LSFPLLALELAVEFETIESVYARLNAIFRDVFDDEDLVVDGDTTAKHVVGWDSLAHVRLLLTVERAFGVRFAASEIAKLDRVGDLVSLLLSKTKAPSARNATSAIGTPPTTTS
jgi:acyl carrier protein